jgi:hypothetical protein
MYWELFIKLSRINSNKLIIQGENDELNKGYLKMNLKLLDYL